MTLYDKSYVLSEPRLGKTGSIILAMDYLQRHRALTGGVLIITTYTTIHSVWANGIRETLPNAIVQIVHGPTRAADLRRPAMRLTVIGIDAKSVKFQATNARCQRIVIGHDQTTFGAGHIFDGVERENGSTPRAHPFTIETGAYGVSRIFNQREVVAFSHCAQFIHR